MLWIAGELNGAGRMRCYRTGAAIARSATRLPNDVSPVHATHRGNARQNGPLVPPNSTHQREIP
jgi:hypothetical protein